MRKYLVPIGHAEQSANTLQFAIDLAKYIGAELYVTKIFTPPSKVGGLAKLERIIQEDMKEELDQVLSKVDTKGVTIHSKPIKGRVEDSIERIGKRMDANMIILSSTTAERNPDVFLGKLSGALVKNSELPIMVVPQNAKFEKLERVLFAFKSGIIQKKTVLGSLQVLSGQLKANIFPLQVVTPSMTEEEKVVSTSLLMKSKRLRVTEAKTIYKGVEKELKKRDYDMVVVVRRKKGFFEKLWKDAKVTKSDFDTDLPLLVLS